MSVTIFPGVLLRWIEQRFLDANGDPLVGGKVATFVAGTSTPLPTYTTSDLNAGEEHTNPIILDAYGRPPSPVFLAAAGYKFIVSDADDVVQYTVDGVVDAGQVFSTNFGLVQNSGSKDVMSGYDVLVLDRFITVDSTGGADPCVINLPSVALATQQLTIKNMGTKPLAVTPFGAETIDGLAAVFTITAAASPTFPAITLVPDGVSGWHVVSSHGL